MLRPLTNKWLWLVAIVALAFGAVLLGGCGSSGGAKAADATSTTAPAAAASPAGATVDGVTVTVERVILSGGDDSTRAKRGHIWLVPKLNLANTGTQAVQVNVADFSVQPAKGDVIVATLPRFLSGPLPEGSLTAGQSSSGKIAFDVLSEEKTVQLRWKPAGGTGEAVVTLEIPK